MRGMAGQHRPAARLRDVADQQPRPAIDAGQLSREPSRKPISSGWPQLRLRDSRIACQVALRSAASRRRRGSPSHSSPIAACGIAAAFPTAPNRSRAAGSALAACPAMPRPRWQPAAMASNCHGKTRSREGRSRHRARMAATGKAVQSGPGAGAWGTSSAPPKAPPRGTSPEPKVRPRGTSPEPQSAALRARPRNPKVRLRGTSPEPWSEAEGCPGSSARFRAKRASVSVLRQ